MSMIEPFESEFSRWRRHPLRLLLAALLVAGGGHPPTACAQVEAGTLNPYFRIPGGTLADALDRFSEQSGLQLIYGADLPRQRPTPETVGAMPPAEVLNHLLAGTGLRWRLLDGRTVAIQRPGSEPPQAPGITRPSPVLPPAYTPPALQTGRMELSDITVVEDPSRVLPAELSRSAFGFNKSLLETPRSVSFISDESIDLFGLSAVEDLVRVVPGTYTPTRFGIQGGVDVRNVPADTFFRGMKRLNLQGHTPTVLSALDSIEVVRGPPSPIYGMGKIGGYTNVMPRSGRAADGRYLDSSRLRMRAVVGSYERSEISANVQGPLSLLDLHGGYQLFAMMLNSESYARGVPLDAKLAQATISLDDVLGHVRLETGFSAQSSRSAGALIGRFTQDLADHGRYIRGVPLVNLDLNGNGSIGYLEYNTASPARGALSTYNQALMQRWNWPLDAQGQPLPLRDFPRVAGIPQAMYDYLQTHPQADPSGVLRAQGVGGPLPASGYLPVGFVLDPATVGFDHLDRRRFAAFERDLHADLFTAFIDLIDDHDPDFTVKNQLFFDGMDQYKISEQPFGTDQSPWVVEDRLTLTHRAQALPSWLRLNTLGALNVRYTDSPSRQCFGDFSTHRSDAMAPTWADARGGMTPNSTFTNCLVNSDIDKDGAPVTDHGRTRLLEIGAGLMFDAELLRSLDVMIGARQDVSLARNIEYADTVAVGGTSAAPGMPAQGNSAVHGWDQGASWSLSVSPHLPYDLRPYVTLAQASLTLDNNANRLLNPVIQAGHIGQSRLSEVGIKGMLLDRRLFISSAAYEQRRINVHVPDDPTITAEVSSTITRGWETEIKWVPARNFFTSLYGLVQKTVYAPNRGGSILIDARSLGFEDVRDPATGAVVYPAEAFLFGGRAFVQLPPNLNAYREKQGNPNTQLGMTLQARLDNGLGASLSGNYFSSVYAGRLRLIRLPQAVVLNAGLQWDRRVWQLRLDAFNLFDEQYFRARNGDTLADLPVSAMPGRRFQFSLAASF